MSINAFESKIDEIKLISNWIQQSDSRKDESFKKLRDGQDTTKRIKKLFMYKTSSSLKIK